MTNRTEINVVITVIGISMIVLAIFGSSLIKSLQNKQISLQEEINNLSLRVHKLEEAGK